MSSSAEETSSLQSFEKEVDVNIQILLSNYRSLLQLHGTLSVKESMGKHQDLQLNTATQSIVSILFLSFVSITYS